MVKINKISDLKELKKRCVICEEIVNFRKDKYVRLTDFTGLKVTGQCYYHLDYWKNRFSITQEKINQQANQWLDTLGNQLNKMKGEGKLDALIKVS